MTFVEDDQPRMMRHECVYHPASLGALLQFLAVADKVMVSTGREDSRDAVVRVVNYRVRIFREQLKRQLGILVVGDFLWREDDRESNIKRCDDCRHRSRLAEASGGPVDKTPVLVRIPKGVCLHPISAANMEGGCAGILA